MSTLIPYNKDDDEYLKKKRRHHFTVPEEFKKELIEDGEDIDSLAKKEDEKTRVAQEDEYQKRKYDSFNRSDEKKSYRQTMTDKERDRRQKAQEEEAEEKEENEAKGGNPHESNGNDGDDTEAHVTKKRRQQENDDKAEDDLSVVLKKSRWETQYEKINFPVIEGIPLTPKILNLILPSGYQTLAVPTDYESLDEQPPDWTEPKNNDQGYSIPQESTIGKEFMQQNPTAEVPKDLQFLKDHDIKHFQSAITEVPNDSLSPEEVKSRKVVKLILKIKNGAPQTRKAAMRSLTDNSRNYGSKLIFDHILPLLKEPTLEDQERHLLVKVVDRILYKLNDQVRPDTRRILTAISPLLIDPDFYSRIEAREIISNLSKAAGLPYMIATLRPDIDSSDEYIRNLTTKTFAVVANALGIPSLLPFLKAVCGSKKSWQARHTGIKTIQQISGLMGSGVLPHLNELISCVAPGLEDNQLSVRTISCLALASLAESSAPFGIESFEMVLTPLWEGMKRHRGKALAAFLKAIGFIIPLMDPEYANHYSKETFHILVREFKNPDDEMRKTCLKIVQQCCATEGVDKSFLKERALDEYFANFWTRRVAMDKRISSILVETTYLLSVRCGVSEIVDRILVHLKDENDLFRKVTVETLDRIITNLGSVDISDRSVDLLLDGIVLAYQEQSSQDPVFLNGFGTVVNSLGLRVKPHLTAIVSVILYRLKHKAPENRQQSADLISLTLPVIKKCGEDDMISRLSNILYESLGEVYPDVLGSLLNALATVISTIGVENVNPSISTILPTLTPILRNRHEKVQEATIKLIGIIADNGPEYVNAREWMRICFELLEMLKSPKKSIRRSANQTFGYLAKAVGPQDVLAALLDNLKVQERQLRVCTAVAIAIVAENCQPFTVLPALMNEYRTPDKNVQNGVLKAMTFIFEYLGENIEQEYIYSLVPLLEDGLTDRDLVHRQLAATVVRHMALGCVGKGLEDVFIHYLNLIMPNIFETSPHVIVRILESLDAIRTNVGPGVILNHVFSGLFHPARKVRHAYWKLSNSAYVQNCDALVPFYPSFNHPTLGLQSAQVEELDIWV